MNAPAQGRFSLRGLTSRTSATARRSLHRNRRPLLETLETRTLLALSITEFPTSGVESGPRQITSGPDNNLWFADESTNQIGRMTTKGEFLGEFPVISPDTIIEDLATGPDRNVWVAQEWSGSGTETHQISRVTPTGIVTSYPTSADPDTMTAGPDGRMWFIESLGPGRLDRPEVANRQSDRVSPSYLGL